MLCLATASGQSRLAIDESKIRAALRNDSTVITIPIEGSPDHAVRASLLLEWLDKEEKASGTVRRDVLVAPGRNSIDVPLPLVNASVWTRLRYSLTPDLTDARAFAPFSGIVALSHIAAHVFELKTSYGGVPRRGSPFTIHGEAVHPVTRLPVPGVTWNATLSIDDKEIAPVKSVAAAEGFVDFTFILPDAPEDDSDEDATVDITAKEGDFGQDVSASVRVPTRMSGRLQSDKPIYQPGQAMHLRGIVTDAQGRAAPGAKVVLRIEDQDNERAHTAHLVASRFGVIAEDWPIPETSSLGTYQIELMAERDEGYALARHVVRISRYELPMFTVLAKPDRSAYLPEQPARVTITANYLFGKPVPKGKVKILRDREPQFNPKTKKSESREETVSQGEADVNGSFLADLDLKADQQDLHDSDNQRFQDIHFAAYYTDHGSGRTEQRRFDVRITKEPIHVYLIHASGSVVYVSTSYADGKPADARVDIVLRNRTTNLHTNQYGIGKAFVAETGDDEEVEIKATDNAGQTGTWKERYWPRGNERLRLETKRTLQRAGESVTLQISSPADAPAEQFVIIHAIANHRAVATRIVRIANHKGEVTFPYQPEFRRTVAFAAWGDARGPDGLASRALIFPDGSDLSISMTPGRPEYKPGEKASLRMQVRSADGKPVEAALGVAVVDQAVLERARTDNEFGHRPWFACAFCRDDGEREIGGIRLNDLYLLPATSPISADLDLSAEALVANTGALIANESSEEFDITPSFRHLTLQMKNLGALLDQNYARSFEYPQDLSTFARILGREWSGLEDPWGQPLRAEFGVERENFIVTVRSSGPDKKPGTNDDFVAATFQRSYFIPLRQLIERILKTQGDYPGTLNDLRKIFSENGLQVDSLRDGWGTPYRVRVTTYGATRMIEMTSAGPDKTFDTKDDFVIADFRGPYFHRESQEISKAIFSAPRPPQTLDEFRRALRNAGIDTSQYRDAWNRPYRLTATIASRYGDKTNIRTVQVFGGQANVKTEVTPVTQQVITFSIRSAGQDGIEDTYDDFDIIRFPVVVKEESASAPETIAKSAIPLKGTGAITGMVTDPSGAVIANVTVTLLDAARMSYEAVTQPDGVFSFVSVPPGVYSIRAASPGFMVYDVSQIPVTAGKTTTLDVVLNVGSVAQMVTVEASPVTMQTQSAQVASSGPVATPRVRDYFPETLLWLPELITDARGVASTQFALADTVTNWKLAVFASTLDGRVAEGEGDLRAFQPFFLDFNPPPVLTEGDQLELPVTVRNYLDRDQKVGIAMEANDWSTVQGSASKQVSVSANSSAYVTYLIHANRSIDKAGQKITARAGRLHDAIQKSSRVHPDGQEVVQNFGDLILAPASFGVKIPQAAIASATRAELRLYPNIASLLLESASSILETPHGCAEQTISAGYANLVAWRFAKAVGIVDTRIEVVALKNVNRTVETLSGFRDADGGIRYWNSGTSDIAVTAHALTFLIEASTW